MPYASLTLILERLDEQTVITLTDDIAADVVGQDAIARAIADADTEIDSSIGKRYATPVDPAPPLLTRLCLDLAIEILYGRRPHVETPEAVVRAAKNARILLANIAANKADIPGIQEVDLSGTGTSGASFSAEDRIFTRATLRGF